MGWAFNRLFYESYYCIYSVFYSQNPHMHLHFFVDWTGGDVIANGSIIVRLNHICFYKCLILAQNMEDIRDPIIQKVVIQV